MGVRLQNAESKANIFFLLQFYRKIQGKSESFAFICDDVN